MRNHYWSIGKFADWVRGTPKPRLGTGEQWRDWEIGARVAHPVRWWLAEEGLEILQNIVYWPTDRLYDLKYYINNRWVTRTHSLTAHPRDIRPGQWRDVGDRFLPCMFNELVDFVEIETAWMQIAWNDEERHKYHPPFWATGWFRWRTWRCPQAGLDNLAWQSQLRWTEDEVGANHKDVNKPTPQAEKAQEILALYHWWKEVYPNRPNAYEASGWSAYCQAHREGNDGLLLGGKDTPELKKQGDRALKLSQKIEKSYEDEDTAMMTRLIRVRHALWT